MTINLHPVTQTLTSRDRGYKMTVNDPLGGVSSMDFEVETVRYSSDKTTLQHEHKTTLTVKQAMTDTEKAQLIPIIGLNGQVISSPITIKPKMSKEQLEGILKIISNSFFMLAIQEAQNG